MERIPFDPHSFGPQGTESVFAGFGKMLVLTGVVLIIIGAVLWLAPSFSFKPFRLPGDIVIKKGNFVFVFPLATCIIISVILTLVLSLLFRR